MTTEEKPTIDQIKAEIKAAVESGDDSALFAATAKLGKFKAEIAKAQVEAQKKEAEALAGDRGKLSQRILGQVTRFTWLADELTKVKATGFTFHPAGYTEADGSVTQNPTVALMVPTVKVKRTGTGGGGTGKTSKDEYGKSLDELYQEFKGQVGLVKALGEEKTGDELMALAGDNNTKQWQVKNAVKKAAIAKSLLKPVA